jgi:hypothetical protein
MLLVAYAACLLSFADPPGHARLDTEFAAHADLRAASAEGSGDTNVAHGAEPPFDAETSAPRAPASPEGSLEGASKATPWARPDARPDTRSEVVETADGEILSADLGDARRSIVEHWEEPEFPLVLLHGAYSVPVGPFDFPGTQRITQTSGFDVAGTLHVHPRVALRLQFHRNRWETQGDAEPGVLDREDYTGRRFEFLYGLDLLGLPYQWRVRPSLSLYGGGGVNWANSTRVTGFVDPVTGTPTGTAEKDKAITLGAVVMVEAGLHVALKKVHFAILGGISKPFMAWKDGFVGDADAFTKALRVQIGVAIGFPMGR